MRRIRTLLAGLALLIAAPALAAPPTVAELEQEVKADKKALKDAEKDLKKIQRYQHKWEKAHTRGNERKEARIDEKIIEWLGEEIVENRRDRRMAKEEFVRMGGDPAALGQTQNSHHRVKAYVPKRAEDDRNDWNRVVAHVENTKEIRNELDGIQPAFTYGTAGPHMYQNKSDLINALVISAKRDIKRATMELKEDQRHLDRRS